MKRIEYVLTLLATSLLLCSCIQEQDGHNYILFLNLSGNRIGYQLTFQRVSDKTNNALFHCGYSASYLDNDSTAIFEAAIRMNWEQELHNDYYVELLIMNGEQLEKYKSSHYPCDVVRQNVPILYTYQLTPSDLEKMNWTIIYR